MPPTDEAARIDAWQRVLMWLGVYRDQLEPKAIDSLQSIVREGITPPAEPDQDTEDAKTVAWAIGIDPSDTLDWNIEEAAKVLSEIKARVRKAARREALFGSVRTYPLSAFMWSLD